MSILDFGKIIFLLIDDLIEWLQSKRLLAVQSSCPVCGTAMDIKVQKKVGLRLRDKSIHKINTQVEMHGLFL